MANYLAQRIIDGVLNYDAVIARYAKYKSDIDAYLIKHGHSDLITTN